MKVLFTLIFTTVAIHPAIFSKTEWLFDNQFCLSDKPSHVINLSSNGAESTITFSMLKDGDTYSPGSNCSVVFQASNNQLLLLTFDVIDTRPHDNITVETRRSNRTLSGYHKCPESDCLDFMFDNIPDATVTFQSLLNGARQHHTGFHGTVTAFSPMDPKKDCPGDDRFKCNNGRCIWEGLHCDGYNHCGDGSDELPGCAKTFWGVLVIVIGVLSVCFFLPLFCYLAVWGPRRKVPIRIMGNTFFRSKGNSSINDEEFAPILVGQPLQGTMPGETFTFYYGTTAPAASNPRC